MHVRGKYMKRALAIAAIADLLFLALALYTRIKDFLFVHQWLLSALAAAPALVIAGLELRHSGEANRLRQEANQFRDEANAERREANAQRQRANEALAQIATHTKRAPTKSERNAERLQRYLGAKAKIVNADGSEWGNAAEIVEIKDEVATLFVPASFSSSSAWATHAQCEDLEIIETPVGSAALTLKVLKRYGTDQNFGQIKSWSERVKPEAAPVFPRGGNVLHAEYVKPASPERRRLDVFESADGRNHYMLVASSGETLYGDNVGISRHFMLNQLEYEAQGFRYNGGGSGGSRYPLFINTRS
jgi:hypothetical protein